jgi:methanogenic corrinoid protein MtbC1
MVSMRQQWVSDEGMAEAAAGASPRVPPSMAGRQRPARGHDDPRHELLRRTVEAAVIPRLVMARRPMPGQAVAPGTQHHAPCGADVAELVKLLVDGAQPACWGFIEAMCAAGTPAETLYGEVLAPAARRLGVMWEEDACGFAEVTVGLVRLQHILRRLEPAFVGEVDRRRNGPRALLVQMPGEQHGFGLAMVVQFFARAGWTVLSEPVATRDDLIGLVRREPLGIVGISVSCSDRLDALATDIRAIRRASRNRRVGIMVGGPVFVEHPQLAAMVGADATASSGSEAVRQAHRLVSLSAKAL